MHNSKNCCVLVNIFSQEHKRYACWRNAYVINGSRIVCINLQRLDLNIRSRFIIKFISLIRRTKQEKKMEPYPFCS